MSAQATSAESESQTKPSLWPVRYGFVFSFFNASNWMVALGTPMVLLLERLGASPSQVGLAFSAVFLFLPVQIVATATLPRFGYKSQTVASWAVRSLFLFVPFAIALMAPEEGRPWMIYAIIGSIFAFCFLRSIGTCGIMPWLWKLIPAELHGRYFATDQMLIGAAGVGTLFLLAGLFTWLPEYAAFTVAYGVAIAGATLSVLALMRLDDVEKPPPTDLRTIARRTPALLKEPGAFRFYVLYTFLFWLVLSGVAPFLAYYLKNALGLETGLIIGLTAGQFIGGITASSFIRSRLDPIGVRPFYILSMICYALVLGFWINHLAGVAILATDQVLFLPGVAGSFFILGMAGNAFFSSHLKYLPQICPEGERALSVSVHSSVGGLAAGLSPMVWGLMIKDTATGGIESGAFLVYLGVTLGVVMVLGILVPFLEPGRTEESSLQLPGLPLRLNRFMANLVTIGMQPINSKEKPSVEKPKD